MKRQREKEDREIDRQREREEMSISKLHGWTGLRERGQSTMEGQYNQEGHPTLGETRGEDKGPFSLAEYRGLQKKNENDHQGSSFSETSKGSFSLAKSDFKETCPFPDLDVSQPEKEIEKSPIAKRRKTEEETREFDKETNKISSERRQTEGETREFDKETSGKVRQTEAERKELDKGTSEEMKEEKQKSFDAKVHPFFVRNTISKLESAEVNQVKALSVLFKFRLS
jgi:hypothetical protein